MGKRGPKKTPTPQLRLTGSTLLAQREGEVEFEAALPEKPDWIGREGGAVFDELVGRLAGVGMLAAVDAEALGMLAHSIAEYRAITAQLAIDGMTCETADGTLKSHPLVAARQQAWQRIKLGWAQFGLSPADRAGLKVGGGESKPTGKRIQIGGIG